MSVEAITWAAKQELGSPAKKLVLLVLANWASDEGITFPSHRKVAKVAELTPERVRVLVRELEAEGYLRRVARYRTESGRGQLSNQYQLLVGGGCQQPGGVVISNQGGVGAGNHPMNTKEIDTKEDTEASPLPAQEGKSENLSPPVKKKGGRDFPNTLRFLKVETHRIYQELRADNWIDHRKPPRDVEPVLREALEYCDGNQEKAAEVVRAALTHAKNDDWWTDKSKSFSMANILRSGRVITFAEKRWAEEKTDATFAADLYDLKSGNPKVKIKEISKRVAHSRDATEEEWYWADDDSKGRFIRPGRAYYVRHLGSPGTPGYEGMAEALSVEQIYVVMRTADGDEIRTHVGNLGRESYERGRVSEDAGVSVGAGGGPERPGLGAAATGTDGQSDHHDGERGTDRGDRFGDELGGGGIQSGRPGGGVAAQLRRRGDVDEQRRGGISGPRFSERFGGKPGGR